MTMSITAKAYASDDPSVMQVVEPSPSSFEIFWVISLLVYTLDWFKKNKIWIYGCRVGLRKIFQYAMQEKFLAAN